MSKFLINIIATSNLAQVLAEDDAALQINTSLLAENTAALQANTGASKKLKKPITEVAQATKAASSETETFTNKVRNSIRHLLGLDDATRKVGYNIMGFSFRVGNWFVPAMMLLASSLLPVIAGLLAIGSAAAIATIGILGLLAVGAIVLTRRKATGSTSGGYGGSRMPYSGIGGSESANVMTTIFQPIVDVLDSSQFRKQTDAAVVFFQATMGALGTAIGNFMTSASSPAFGIIKDLFLTWLPAAGTSLARWGSRILGLIGVGSLTRINKFFVYLAQGIENTSKWLAKGGGWQNIDMLLGIIGDIISVLMTLGKSAFPVFLKALSLVWPNPLRPLFLAAAQFFKDVSESENALNTLGKASQWMIALGVGSIFLKAAGAAIAFLLGESVLFVAGVITLFGLLYLAITQGVTILVSVVKYLMLELYDFLMGLGNDLQVLLGHERIFNENRTEGMSLDEALSGAYAPSLWYEHMQRDRNTVSGIYDTGKAAAHAIDIYFHPDEANITRIIESEAGNMTGNFTSSVDSNLRARRTVSL